MKVLEQLVLKDNSQKVPSTARHTRAASLKLFSLTLTIAGLTGQTTAIAQSPAVTQDHYNEPALRGFQQNKSSSNTTTSGTTIIPEPALPNTIHPAASTPGAASQAGTIKVDRNVTSVPEGSVDSFFQTTPVATTKQKSKSKVISTPYNVLWHTLDNLGVPMFFNHDPDIAPELSRPLIMPPLPKSKENSNDKSSDAHFPVHDRSISAGSSDNTTMIARPQIIDAQAVSTQISPDEPAKSYNSTPPASQSNPK